MNHNIISRIISQADGHLIIRYWTPREYADKHPYVEPTKINELVDKLNSSLYAEVIQSCVDVRAPHTYGVFQV
jgi:DNA-directed RNA polymerase subunit F